MTTYEEYLREQNEDFKFSYDERYTDAQYAEYLEEQLYMANEFLEAAKDDMGDLIASVLAENKEYQSYVINQIDCFWFSNDEALAIVEESKKLKGKHLKEIIGYRYTSKWPPDKEDK